MRVSIIIPTYNRLPILKRCLDCLANQEGVDLSQVEVLVVDDGSRDGTGKAISDHRSSISPYPFELRYFHQENMGQGNARNVGLDHARGEIVCFIGDDILFEPDCLVQHLAVHDAFPDETVACLGFTTWHHELPVSNFMYFLEHGGHQFAYHAIRKQFKIKNLKLKIASFWFFYTSNISVKRSLIEGSTITLDPSGLSTGHLPLPGEEKSLRFAPVYTSYGWEDTEFGYRLERERGMKLLYNPLAKAEHHHIVTIEGFEQKMRSIAKNALIFHDRFPEVPVLPNAFKRFVFRVLSWRLTLWKLKMLGKVSPKIERLYFYATMKKCWMEGTTPEV